MCMCSSDRERLESSEAVWERLHKRVILEDVLGEDMLPEKKGLREIKAVDRVNRAQIECDVKMYN